MIYSVYCIYLDRSFPYIYFSALGTHTHTHAGVIYEQAVVSSLLPSWVLAMAVKCIRCPAFCPNLNFAFSLASPRGETMLAHNSTDIINHHQTAL